MAQAKRSLNINSVKNSLNLNNVNDNFGLKTVKHSLNLNNVNNVKKSFVSSSKIEKKKFED